MCCLKEKMFHSRVHVDLAYVTKIHFRFVAETIITEFVVVVVPSNIRLASVSKCETV